MHRYKIVFVTKDEMVVATDKNIDAFLEFLEESAYITGDNITYYDVDKILFIKEIA